MHLYIRNDVYQTCTFSVCKSKVYEGDGGPLERSKSTPRGSKIGKTTFWTQRAKEDTPGTINIAGKSFKKEVFNLRSTFKGQLLGSTILKTSICSRKLGVLCAITHILLYFEGGR